MATKSVKGAGRTRLAPATTLAVISSILVEAGGREVLQRPRIAKGAGGWTPATLETLNLESFNYRLGDLRTVRVSIEGKREYVYFVSVTQRSHGPYSLRDAEAMLRSAYAVMSEGGSAWAASEHLCRTIWRGDYRNRGDDKPENTRTREFLHVGCQTFKWAPLLEFMRQRGWDKKKKSTRKGPKR